MQEVLSNGQKGGPEAQTMATTHQEDHDSCPKDGRGMLPIHMAHGCGVAGPCPF